MGTLAETCYRVHGSEIPQGYACGALFLLAVYVIVRRVFKGSHFVAIVTVGITFGLIMIVIGNLRITSDPVPC